MYTQSWTPIPADRVRSARSIGSGVPAGQRTLPAREGDARNCEVAGDFAKAKVCVERQGGLVEGVGEVPDLSNASPS